MVYQFWTVFLVLIAIFIFFDVKYGMLRDTSNATPPPYSWGRVQLAWWTAIILSIFIAVYWKTGNLPDLDSSTLILLGISAGTTTASRLIDVADLSKGVVRHQDSKKDNILLDLLSDENGVSIHRFQTLVFNLVFGLWFISESLQKLAACIPATCDPDKVMPPISDNNLILLGVSAAAYAAMKTTENSTPSPSTQSNTPVSTTTTTTITTPVARVNQ